MRRWSGTAVVFVMTFLATTALTLGDVRLASPVAITLTAPRADIPVPMDPWARIWDRATAVQVPLSAQTTTPPVGGEGGDVIARAMHTDKRLYVLLEWKDYTHDLSVGKPELFADQSAIQFPTTNGQRVPFFCMGDPGATVNIWLWKASRQKDVDRGYQDVKQVHPRNATDEYPLDDDPAFYPPRALGNIVASTRGGPVESLVAGGFGSATTSDTQSIAGIGRWKRSTWRVLFARDLVPSTANHVAFHVPETTSVAFAIWNGAARERNGLKSVAQFASLALTDQPLGPAPPSRRPLAVATALIVILGAVGASIALARRRRAFAGSSDDRPAD